MKDPTLEDSYRKEMDVDGAKCILEIVDTAATEQYNAMHDLYMRNADGFVTVYSITDLKSFDEVAEVHERILRMKDTDRFPIVLVGNKCDLSDQRAVSTDQGQQMADKIGDCGFVESSAKTNTNVEVIFKEMVLLINDFDVRMGIDRRRRKKKVACSLL